MNILLTETEARVLGCLIEKEITTPEYYPLSLNALRNACNQTSNRDPIVAYDEMTVADALETLKQKDMISQDNISRVPKFGERFLKITNLMPSEIAILCVLLLRGPQTGGELRGRTERLYSFGSIDEVEKVLNTLTEWGYVTLLPRQPGKKEQRYTHLLTPLSEAESLAGGAGALNIEKEEKTAISKSVVSDFLLEHQAFKALQTEVSLLRQELDELKKTITDFKAQF